MKVIGINGSPKKEGNTSILIKTVFEELEKEGIETEIINIGSKPISGCLACGKCRENMDNKCVIKNDIVNKALEKAKDADGIILGSPVYFADVSSQMKAFIDRFGMVGLVNGILKRKVGASVVAVRRAGALPAFHSMNSLFTISEMMTVGSTYWNMGYGRTPGEVNKDEEGLQTMRNLGKNMVWLLKSIENSKGEIKEPDTVREVMTSFIR